MKKTGIIAFAALALLAVGCVGKNNSFCLYKGLAEWNRTWHEEKWMNELVFVGLHIIPVYQVCELADVLVLNSIDFWTGDNPAKDVFAGSNVQESDYQIVSNGDGTATLTYKGRVCTLTRVADGVELSKDGVTLGTFSQHGSLATFTGADGSVQTAIR